MSSPNSQKTRWRELLSRLWDLGRKISTQTVFLHQAIAQSVGLNATDTKCIDLILSHPDGSMTAGCLSDMTGLTTGAITPVHHGDFRCTGTKSAALARMPSTPGDWPCFLATAALDFPRPETRLRGSWSDWSALRYPHSRTSTSHETHSIWRGATRKTGRADERRIAH
jgi:hypothetical protein